MTATATRIEHIEKAISLVMPLSCAVRQPFDALSYDRRSQREMKNAWQEVCQVAIIGFEPRGDADATRDKIRPPNSTDI
jgi:hypothetical protein